jgi:hypothetical protein
MKLVKEATGDVIILGGKHNGKKLKEVAEKDPKYINWIFRKETFKMSDYIYHQLCDVMAKNNISDGNALNSTQETGD